MKQRSLMRRRGVEDVKGGTPIVTPSANEQPRRRKLSKAELREQAEAAFLAWRAGQTSKNK
jgi:tRNA A37 threonylcarbamoyladenosine synthetase subunit TsaC/SUA5/YrdC